MKAERKTKAQLVKELDDLRRRINEPEAEKSKDKQTAADLKESESRFRNIIESSKDGIIFFDGKTRKIILGNKAMAKLLGCSKKALVGRSIPSLHPPEEWASIEKSFKKHLRGELTVSAGIPLLRNDGSILYADIFSSLTMLEGRTCFSAFFRDITERKQAEEALRENEETFRTLAENANDGIFITVGKGIQAFANKRAGEITGYSKAELLKTGIQDLIHPDEVQKIMERYKKRLAGEPVPTQYEIIIIRKDGKSLPIELTASKTFWHGQPADLVIVRDIAERKQYQEALRESEEKYRNLVERANDGIGIGQEGILVYINPRLAHMAGYSVEEVIGLPFSDFFMPDEVPKVVERYRRRIAGEEVPPVYESALRHKDGSKIEVEVNAGIITYREKPADLVFIRDSTERKRAEKELRENEARLKAQYQGSPIPTFTWQKRGKIFELVDFNPAAKVMTRGEVMKYFRKTADEMYQDRPEILQDLHRCFIEKEVIKRELQSQHFMPGRTIVATYAFVPPDLVMVYADDITERKQLEEALRESEENFRNVFENSSVGMSMTSLDGSVYVNQALSEMLGYSKEELSGHNWQDLTHPDDIELTQEHLEQLLSGEKISIRFIKRYIKKDGSVVWGDLNTVLQRGKDGRPLHYISGLLDITERKRWEALIERTMRETRVRFEVSQALAGQETEDEVLDVLIQQAGFYPQTYVAICTIDNQGEERAITLRRADPFESGVATIVPIGTRFPSSRFESLNRYSIDQPFTSNDIGNDERIDLASLELIHQVDASSFAFFPLTVGKEGMGFIATLAKPGHYFDKEKQLLYQTLAEQGAVALRAARLREQICESQKRFQGLVETLSDWIWEVNQDGIYTYVSPKIRDLLGFEPEELLGKTPFDLMPPEEARRVSSLFKSLRDARQPLVTLENTCRHKDGRLIVFETSGLPFFNGEGQFKGYRGVDRDITKRKRAEEALRQAEEKYRAIVENAVEGIFQSTSDGKFLMVNTAVAKFHGYDSPEELMAAISNIGEQLYVHPEDRQRYRRLLADEGVVKGFENQFYRKDGTIKWGSMNVRSVKDNEGHILHYEGTIEDITARKEAEEGLQKSLDKLRKALGGVVQAISLTVETRDPYTAGHQRRVADLARAIAQEMGLPEDQVDALRMAGVVHDLGKISIPAEILSKPAQLSNIEFSLIKAHPQISYDILKDIDFNWPVAEIVLQHHERINGSGYPNGLSGKDIYLEARILAVADVVEAISSHRPYRPAFGIDVALEEIEKNKEVLYDPEAVEACLRLFRKKGFKFE